MIQRFPAEVGGTPLRYAKIQRFKDSRIQGFKDSRISRRSGRDSATLRKDSKIQGFKDSRIQGFPAEVGGTPLRYAKIQRFKDSKIQGFKNSKITKVDSPAFAELLRGAPSGGDMIS
jgi:hypothetical protein